jgi:hypothetical protein
VKGGTKHNMFQASQKSEEFIRDVLIKRYDIPFNLVSTMDQRDGVARGWHVPDIHCPKYNTHFEVKEDKLSADTGNLAFEAHCMDGMKRWWIANKPRSVLWVYINHKTFDIDIFDVGINNDGLYKELEYFCSFHPMCSERLGGDQMFKLWIVPLVIARKFKSCITGAMFSELQLKDIRERAKSILGPK